MKSQDTSEVYIVGEINKSLLQQQPYSKWFNNEYNNYKPDEKIITELKKQNLDNLKINIFLGIWCEDSKIQVPRFLKILDNISFNYKNVKMYAVNKKKEAIGNYKVERVPTFIFERNGKEIGRITENPIKTLEHDFFNIIK
ncbi:MAG: thioredoxin family protein [Bacteroidales bacterium]|nr:thioredoxin family protein [Bacteroidales bacterium]